MKFTVDKAKLKHLQGTLKILGDKTKNWQKPLKTSAKIIKLEAIENFDRQGYVYGRIAGVRSSWTPLAPSTRVSRARRGYGSARPILVNTGKLKKGFKMKDLTKNSVKVENVVSYGSYHQTGTRKMPQRLILGVTEKRKKAIRQLFSNFIQK